MENAQGIIRSIVEPTWMERILHILDLILQIGENIEKIIRTILELPHLVDRIIPIAMITIFIVVILTAWIKFKKSPIAMGGKLRSELFKDLDTARFRHKRYNLIIHLDGTSPIRLEHTYGTLLGNFYCTSGNIDEKGRPIPLHKTKKRLVSRQWETIVYESQNTSLIQDFFFTSKENSSLVHDWQSCQQIGKVTLQTQPLSAHLSGPELSAEIKMSNWGIYGEVCVLSDDGKYLGFLHQESVSRTTKYTSVDYSLLLADNLKQKQLPVVIAALMMCIQIYKAAPD